MTIKLEHHPEQKDIGVLITYPQKNKTVERIEAAIKSIDMQIECHSGDALKLINVSDINYIESVDKTTVVFCENGNYKTKFRLYQIYEKLEDRGFIQISKYCIINISKLEKVKPLLNSHLEATLSNGTCLHVTRKYLSGMKRKLQENE